METVISGGNFDIAAIHLQRFLGIKTVRIGSDGNIAICNVDKAFCIIVGIFTVDSIGSGVQGQYTICDAYTVFAG